MKTRSQSLPPSDPTTPTKSILRKRRYSGVDYDHEDINSTVETRSHHVYIDKVTQSRIEDCRTPQKQYKRVRFSESNFQQPRDTGLTPHLRRSTLSEPRCSSAKGKLEDCQSQSRDALSVIINPFALIEQRQFAPLREVLDSRLRRRLRRSHLSEEQNEIVITQQAEARTQQELSQLREQDTKQEQRIKTLTWELEAQRQLGIDFHDDEPKLAKLGDNSHSLRNSDHITSASLNSDLNPSYSLGGEEERQQPCSSPFEDETFFSSPTHYERKINDNNTPLKSPTGNRDVYAQNFGSKCFNQEFDNEVREHAELTTRELQDAKDALNLTHQELTAMGFTNGDSSDLGQTLSTIRDTFRRVRLELEYVLPGETTCGLEDGNCLLESLISHLKKLAEQVDGNEKVMSKQKQKRAALHALIKRRARRAERQDKKIAWLRTRKHKLQIEVRKKEQLLTQLRQRNSNLCNETNSAETQIDELKQQSRNDTITIQRFQLALETYRDEVKSLETLVNTMDKANKASGFGTKAS